MAFKSRRGLTEGVLCAGAVFLLAACATLGFAPPDGVWDDMGEPSDGLVAVRTGQVWGYADVSGGCAILPQFSEALPFSNDRAAVRLTARWGYIDRDGKYIVAPSYQAAGSFSEGLAPVKTAAGWGYVDESGKMVIDAQYDEAGPFSEGLAAVRLSQRWGYIDRDGRNAISFQFKAAGRFSGGKAPAAKLADDNEWGFIDRDGKFVIQPSFDGAHSFTEDHVAAVLLDERWGFIDESGAFIVNPRFATEGDFADGFAPVNDKGRWGFIDKDGNFPTPPQWTLLGSLHEGWARAEAEAGKVSLIDSGGAAADIRADRGRLAGTPVQAGQGKVTVRIDVRDYLTHAPIQGYSITRAVGDYGEYVIPDPQASGADGVILLSMDEARFNQTRELFGEKSGYYGAALDISGRKAAYAITTLSLDTELPRIDEVLLTRDNVKDPVNILFQQEVFESRKPDTAGVSFKVFNPRFTIKKYFLQQGTKRVESDSPDFSVEVGKVFSVDDPIHAGVVIDFQDMAVTLPTYLAVKLPRELEKPITTLPVDPTMTVPGNEKFFAGHEGTFKIPGVSFGVTYEDDIITLYIGAEDVVCQNGHKGLANAFKTWVKEVAETTDYARKVWGYWRGHNPKPANQGSGMMQSTMGAVGYVELAYGKHGLEVVGGRLMIVGEFGYEYSAQMMAGFLPVYASFGVGGKVSVMFKAEDGKSRAFSDFFQDVTLTITPQVECEGGVGVKGLASVGVAAHGELPMKFETRPVFKTSGQFILDLSVRARLLFVFSWEYKLWEKTWEIWKTGQSPDNGEPAGSIPDMGTVTDQFRMEDRSYLEAGSQWLGGQAPPEITGDKPPVAFQPIKTNILPGSEPLVLQALGREFLFWTDDAGRSRAGADRAVLMFSVRQGDGSWADPRMVHDSGTADYDFSVVEHRGVLYAAWQNTTKKFGTDAVDYHDACVNSQILVAAYDPKTGNFGEPKHITGPVGGNYLGRPRLASDGKMMALTWVQNTAGDYFLQKGSTFFDSFRMNGDAWGAGILLLYSPPKVVISHELFVRDETPYLVTVEDEDGSFATVNDRRLVLVHAEYDWRNHSIQHREVITESKGSYGNPRLASWKGNNALFYFAAEGDSGKGNYWYLENVLDPGTPRQVFPEATLSAEDFSIIRGPGDKLGLLFVDEGKEGSNKLQSTPAMIVWDQKRGRWSLPVRIWAQSPDPTKRAEAAKGVWTAEDRIDVVYRSLPATTQGKAYDPVPTDMVFASTIPAVDLVITPRSIYRYYEPEIGGCLVPFSVEVTNQGLATAEGVVTDIIGPYGNASKGYEKAYKNIELRPGDTVMLPMEFRIPPDAQSIDARVSVRPLRGHEIYTGNNSTPIRFADPALGFGNITMIRTSFERRFVVEALNRSPVRIRNVELHFIDDSNGSEITLAQLGTIMPNATAVADFTINLGHLDWHSDSRKLLHFELRSSDVQKGAVPGANYVLFNPYSYPAFSLAVFDARASGTNYVWVTAAATNNHPVQRSGTLVIDILDENDKRVAGDSVPVTQASGRTALVTKLFHVDGSVRACKVRVSMTNVSKTEPGADLTGGLMDVGGDPVPVEVNVMAGDR